MKRKWKTYILLGAMESPWMTGVLTRVGRRVSDALKAPEPNRGNSKGWEYLGDMSEVARYSVIVGFIRRLKPGGAVLDVGSSNGVLADELQHEVSSIRGIEYDPASVEKAVARNIPNAQFSVGDANAYATPDCFDVIVFNETMYYLKDPITLLHRYAGFLKPGGIMITSNYVARYLLRFPGEIARNFTVIEQATVLNSRGLGWTIQVISPKSPE